MQGLSKAPGLLSRVKGRMYRVGAAGRFIGKMLKRVFKSGKLEHTDVKDNSLNFIGISNAAKSIADEAGGTLKQWDGLLLTLGHVSGKLEFHKSVSMKRSPP